MKILIEPLKYWLVVELVLQKRVQIFCQFLNCTHMCLTVGGACVVICLQTWVTLVTSSRNVLVSSRKMSLLCTMEFEIPSCSMRWFKKNPEHVISSSEDQQLGSNHECDQNSFISALKSSSHNNCISIIFYGLIFSYLTDKVLMERPNH